MSPVRPVGRRTIAVVAAVAALAVATGFLLDWLLEVRPTGELDAVVAGAPDPRGEETDVLVCRRTLPGRPPAVEPGPSGDPALVRSNEVVSCPERFDAGDDGAPLVRFVGEVVGDVLRREGGAWVLVNDDAFGLEHGPLPAHEELEGTNTGLSVWLPEEVIDLEALEPGRPGRRGDVLLLTGLVFRADPADGGGLTLRVQEAEVIADAVDAPEPLHVPQALAAAGFAVLALAATAYERLSRGRRYVRSPSFLRRRVTAR